MSCIYAYSVYGVARSDGKCVGFKNDNELLQDAHLLTRTLIKAHLMYDLVNTGRGSNPS